MAKRRKIPVRSLGSESEIPALPDLADWAGNRAGKTGDLMTYRLESALLAQTEAGVQIPCAGGPFYESRVLESFEGIQDRVAVGELGVRMDDITDDARQIGTIWKSAWWAFPSPGSFGLRDRYFDDDGEFRAGVYGMYRHIMREMRDWAVAGHILIADHADEQELESLAGQKVFFFIRDPSKDDLALLLEYQRDIAVFKDRIGDVLSFEEEFEIRTLIIIDPDETVFHEVLLSRDPDTIATAGFCTERCDRYWNSLVESSFVMLT
jgi:hypothetical protein